MAQKPLVRLPDLSGVGEITLSTYDRPQRLSYPGQVICGQGENRGTIRVLRIAAVLVGVF